jgi:hypothetical protein
MTRPALHLDDSESIRAGGVPVLLDDRLEFATPQLNAVRDAWEIKRGSRQMPSRGDFGIADLKSALSNVALLDIIPGENRTRFKTRFMGSELDTQITPMTGHYADEVLPAFFLDKWTSIWMKAIEGCQPLRSISRAEFKDRRYSFVETIYAPLADDGATPNIILIGLFYHEVDAPDPRTRRIAEKLVAEFTSRCAAS